MLTATHHVELRNELDCRARMDLWRLYIGGGDPPDRGSRQPWYKGKTTRDFPFNTSRVGPRRKQNSPHSLYFGSFGHRFIGHMNWISTTSLNPASIIWDLYNSAELTLRPSFSPAWRHKSPHFFSAESSGQDSSSTLRGKQKSKTWITPPNVRFLIEYLVLPQ